MPVCLWRGGDVSVWKLVGREEPALVRVLGVGLGGRWGHRMLARPLALRLFTLQLNPFTSIRSMEGNRDAFSTMLGVLGGGGGSGGGGGGGMIRPTHVTENPYFYSVNY